MFARRFVALAPLALTTALGSAFAGQPPAELSLYDVTLGEETQFLTLGHDQRFDVLGAPGEFALVLGSARPPVPGSEWMGVPLAIDYATFSVLFDGALDGGGAASFPFTVPTHLLTGMNAHTQAVLVDPVTLEVRLTNGVRATVQSEPFEVLEQGSHSAHPLSFTIEGGAVVVHDEVEWGEFWALHKAWIFPQPPAFDVDFDQHAVVAVFAGVRATGGYSIVVDDVVYHGEDPLAVHATEYQPGAGCIVTLAITHPYQLLLVPREVAAAEAETFVTPVVYDCTEPK